MTHQPTSSPRFTFGVFELRPSTGELHRGERSVHLAPQPTRVLTALVDRAGQVVTRDELKALVWGGETFVDFEQGLNFCIKQIRAALGDDADNPRFVETVPRRGYKFIAPVERTDPVAAAVPLVEPPIETPAAAAVPEARQSSRFAKAGLAAAAVIAAIAVTVAVLWFRGQRQSTTSSISTIAVLPFGNLSGDRAQDYFSDGFTEELIAQLGRTDPERLRVIARTSTLSYRGSSKTAAEIGRELGAQHLVEGTVRHSGDRVRINAQLIRVSDQSHVWAEIYEGEVRDILQLQREVGDSIARQILSTLGPVGTAAAPARAVDPAVYDLYLRARYDWNTRFGPAIRRAEEAFRELTRRDPTFAPAWAGLAQTILITHRAEALEAAERAIALDARLAEAHAAKAVVLEHMLRWDWAEEEYRKAIALDPSHVATRYFYSEFLSARGRCAPAIEQAQQALALDPRSAIVSHVAGATYYYCGEFDRALPYFKKAIALDPTHTWSHMRIGFVLEQRREYEAAFAEFALAGTKLRSAYTYALAGQKHHARRLVDEALNSPDVEFEAYHIAAAYVGLGEYDEAIKWLDLAVTRQLYDVIFLYADPRFQPLRELQRYKELLQKGGW
ncbi:MAG TPA: tetratricopeptide repeat protein [Vicinamibacterales bacterium]|jgi:TolB-like protein/DNA-binding winged helix-turn-helix (wHTH) protein/Tfp pilus assembly protein PilF